MKFDEVTMVLGNTFPNMSHPTISAYEQYYSDTGTVKEIEQWESGKVDKLVGPIHGFLPSAQQPLFQLLNLRKSFQDGGTMVSESENCFAIIPAGFRNGDTYNTLNPVKYSIGKMSSLMSICHVLVIPKHVRIYNAVTLRKKHLRLLSEMEELGATALTKLVKGTTDIPGSIRWQLVQTGNISMSDGTHINSTLEQGDFSENCRDSFHGLSDGRFKEIQEQSLSHMKFSFHLNKMASIGYLHMHCYLGNLLTKGHDMMEQQSQMISDDHHVGPKNTPLDEVIYMMNSGKLEDIRGWE